MIRFEAVSMNFKAKVRFAYLKDFSNIENLDEFSTSPPEFVFRLL